MENFNGIKKILNNTENWEKCECRNSDIYMKAEINQIEVFSSTSNM